MPLDLGNTISTHDFIKLLPHVYCRKEDEYAWIRHEQHSYIKYPVTHLETPPDKSELKEIFSRTNAKLLSYAERCESSSANAYWYVCRSIAEPTQGSYMRNLKTARKNLTVKKVALSEFYEHGYLPFSETRKRNGLDDTSPEYFAKRFNKEQMQVRDFIIGAYHGEELVSYMPLILFHNFAEFEGPYTKTNARKYCPNELLIFTALDYCINQRKLAFASYGFSSIQASAGETRLHEFKIKCGFDALPIKRVFVFNPKIKWLINPLTRLTFMIAEKLFPKNKRIRKINGVLNQK